MIFTLFSWFWIGISSFLCGFAVLELPLLRKPHGYRRTEQYILMGLCFLTVYAQTFSLFGQVSGLATGILMILCLIIVLGLRKNWIPYIKQICSEIKWYHLVMMGLITLFALTVTSYRPILYDTDLYHAQAIRWIEQYGVVKGLGNLHNRLAYNSSFFSLQALFSLKFLVNQSMHSINGFITLVMLKYGVLEYCVFRRKKPEMSDIFRICLIWYFFVEGIIFTISSPGSDLLAQSLLLYLCAEWSRLIEDQDEYGEYGILCVLAVWAVTVKLSAAMVVLLTVYPAICLIREKKWKQIGLFLAMGLMIVFPFLARNVVISGYLLYPNEKLDLFHVDWKMPASVVSSDSAEIKAWGRGITSFEQYNVPMSEWLPIWYGTLSIGFKIMLWLSVFCMLFAVVYTVMCMRKRKGLPELTLLGTCIAGLLSWFFTTPNIRYGLQYLLLLPAFFIGIFLKNRFRKVIAYAALVVLLCFSVKSFRRVIQLQGFPPVKRPVEYTYMEAATAELEGYIFYVGEGTDQVGYHYFPSTTSSIKLTTIELRTGKLEGGFRVREEYQNTNLLNSGDVLP